ncbi:hypothetical protein BJN34_26515 [Cupriavidus necator]|uniref:DUF4148 domain-containing protein n=1 Tax=Cupriavidus necator TaxID=106590 RepID=A0A1U9UXM1_CUPNE|nr:hypothetical protein [Cupriavidus necator]AQV97420.1 hypothetical protein BJN34_26515 [Cupriavidus necator]
MIRTRILMAIAATAFAAFANPILATVNDHPGTPPAGAVQPNDNASRQLAASSLDNAREGDGTLYGYRV